MPFNMGLELMAGAALQVFTGKVLTTIKKAKALGWLLLEQETQHIRIAVDPKPGQGEADISLYSISSSSEEKDQLVLQATMLFADTYPLSPPAPSMTTGDCAPLMTRDDIYPRHMFHGPSFQSIVVLQQCEENRASALLDKPDPGLFLSWPENTFLTEPQLLDGAGQLVGLWAIANLDEHFVVFPAAVEQISFYGQPSTGSLPVSCDAEPRLQGDSTIVSRINLFSPRGTLLAEIRGQQHRRITMPEIIHRFRGNRDILLSSSWEPPLQHYPAYKNTLSCCRLQGDCLDLTGSDRKVLLAVLAHIVLGRNERRQWYSMKAVEKRKKEWLLARLVGKEAIRRLLRKQGQDDVWPADIEILPDELGKPIVCGQWTATMESLPSVSLSHGDNTIVALAAVLPPRASVGIDIEKARKLDKEFIAFSFSSAERQIVSDDQEKALRCWCAKEAAAKALGFGMPGGPGDMIVTSYDDQTGEIQLETAGVVATERDRNVPSKINAFSVRDGEIIVATAISKGMAPETPYSA